MLRRVLGIFEGRGPSYSNLGIFVARSSKSSNVSRLILVSKDFPRTSFVIDSSVTICFFVIMEAASESLMFPSKMRALVLKS